MYKIEDINYMVSLFCPGECVNCNIWQYEKEEITKDELCLEHFQKLLRSKYMKGCNYFDLTAGESQLSPKFVDVVRSISEVKPEAFIHTNISGWYPKKHFEVTKASLAYVKKENFRLDIALDGSKESYSKVRLVKSGYEKVMQTIELLKPLGVKLRVVMIVYKENYHDIPWVVNFAKEQGIDYFIGYSRNAGLLKNEAQKYSYSEDELSKIESLLEEVEWLNERRRPNWLWAKSIYQNNIPLFNCFMGQRALVLDPFGNVFPCNECLDSLKMGNISDFEGDLDALLESQRAKDVITSIEQKKCQPCSMLCAHKIEFPWGKQAGMQ